MEKRVVQLFFCSFFIVLVLNTCPATSQEVDDEREFDYNQRSERGPARWGHLRSEWSMCKDGSMQSPIDLLNDRVDVVSHLGRLNRSYKSSNATLRNRGHDIMLQWEGSAGHIQINVTRYDLHQCHWHSPSEHTINGRWFDLEVHMVHESSLGKIAVVGIMYKIGRPDSFLSSMKEHFAAIAGTHEEVRAVGTVDPKHLRMGSRKYYRYIGSLTVPPCTQNVVWTIVRKVRTVTEEQVRLLRVAVHDDSETNARPLQPLNRRSVHLYRPSDERKGD